MAASAGKVKLKIYLDNDQTAAEILVSSATKCTSIVQRLKRQLHATDCYLVELWQGCERVVPEQESILPTLMDWGSDLEDVQFYLHSREPNMLLTEESSHADSQDHLLNGLGDRKPQEREMLPGGHKSTVDELQELAVKQQQEIAAKERELKIKEHRLYSLKKSRKKCHPAYMHRLETEVEERNNKLTKLWQVQDEVESYKLSNGVLAGELVKIRDLFSAREKELAIAVTKVNSLTQQLEEQRQGWGELAPLSATKSPQEIELERLRKELMMRNELNHQQSVQLQAQRQLMAEKHNQLFELDAQIESLSAEVHRKRSRSDTKDENHDEEEEEEEEEAKQKQQATKTWRDVSRVRTVTPRPLGPLLEEEEGDGHASDTEIAAPSKRTSSPSRVGKLKSLFEESPAQQVGAPTWIKREFDHRAGKNTGLGEMTLSLGDRVNGSNFADVERTRRPGRQIEDGVSQGKINLLKREYGVRAVVTEKLEENGFSLSRMVNGDDSSADGGHAAIVEKDVPMPLSSTSSPLDSNTRVGQGIPQRNAPKPAGIAKDDSNTVQSESLTPKASSELVLSPRIVQTTQKSNANATPRNETLVRNSDLDHAKPTPSELSPALFQSATPLRQDVDHEQLLGAKGAFTDGYKLPYVKGFLGTADIKGSKIEPLNRCNVQDSDSADAPNPDKLKHVSAREAFNLGDFEQPSTMEPSNTGVMELFDADSLEHKESFNINDYKDTSTKEPLKTGGFKQPTKQPFISDELKYSTGESFNTLVDQFEPSSAITASGVPAMQSSRKSHTAKVAFSSNVLDVDKTFAVKRSPLLSNKRRTYRTDIAVAKLNTADTWMPDNDPENASEEENSLELDISSPERVNASTELVEESVKDGELSKSENVSTLEEERVNASTELVEESVKDGELSKSENEETISSRHVQRNKEKPSKHVVSSFKIKLSSTEKPLNSKLALETSDSPMEYSAPLRDRVPLEERNVDSSVTDRNISDMEHDSSTAVIEEKTESKSCDISTMDDTNTALAKDFESGYFSEKHRAHSFPRKSALRKSGGMGRVGRRVNLHPLVVLLDAAVEGDLEVVKDVIRQVDDPSKPNLDGISALHNAVCGNHEQVVMFLVESGCDINLPDSHGWTPLHCAAANNNIDMVQYLLEHGACVFAATALEKKTPCQCCDRGFPGYLNCSKYLFNVEHNLGVFNSGRVYALFSYSACHADELSFECDEELSVSARGDDIERDWWWAANGRGETGYIPRNLLGICPRIAPEV